MASLHSLKRAAKKLSIWKVGIISVAVGFLTIAVYILFLLLAPFSDEWGMHPLVVVLVFIARFLLFSGVLLLFVGLVLFVARVLSEKSEERGIKPVNLSERQVAGVLAALFVLALLYILLLVALQWVGANLG